MVLWMLGDSPVFWRLPAPGVDDGWLRRRVKPYPTSLDLLHERAHVEQRPRQRTLTFAVEGVPIAMHVWDEYWFEPPFRLPVRLALTVEWSEGGRRRLLKHLKLGVAATQRFMNTSRAKARMRQSNVLPQIEITARPIQPNAPSA